MCLVIDINTIHSVFNPQSEHHDKYQPILNWIVYGKGKMVCGGTKYWNELRAAGKYIRFFNQLNKAGKVVKIDDHDVDVKMNQLMAQCNDPDFDDPHIAALLIVSGCKIICTEDERSFPYIKNKEWYPKGIAAPKIYKRTSHRIAAKLLCDENIAEVCLPCQKLNKGKAIALVPR